MGRLYQLPLAAPAAPPALVPGGASRASSSPSPGNPASTASRAKGQPGEVPFLGGDEQLAKGVRESQPAAVTAYYQRYQRPVRALLVRLLGADDELDDLHHEVFLRALESIASLRDPHALGSWTLGVAARVARIRIQRKRRRWWLSSMPSDELPEIPVPAPDEATRRACLAAQRFVLSLPADERIAFVLRHVEGMTLAEAASAARTSTATLKRRLSRARERLDRFVEREPEVAAWLDEVRDES